jgi:hypothetical protein
MQMENLQQIRQLPNRRDKTVKGMCQRLRIQQINPRVLNQRQRIIRSASTQQIQVLLTGRGG